MIGRDPRATMALLEQALQRMPGNIDAMIGLAGVHLQLGSLDAAADWCNRALLTAPDHASARRVRAAIVDAYVRRSAREVIDGRLSDAIDRLSRAAAMTESHTAGLYRDLFLLASAWFRDAAKLQSEHGTIRLSLPVWGADYIAIVTSGLLRSLLAPGNLPALARTQTVRLEITTSARDKVLLEDSPVLAAVARHAEIIFFILPDHLLIRPGPPDFAYWLMSVGHHVTAERARHAGTGVCFFTADMILANGSLEAAQRLLESGTQAVLVSALEIEHDDVVGAGNGERGGPLSIAPDALVRLALAHLKAEMADRTAGSGDPAGFQLSNSASFAIDGGVALYGFHFLPLMVSPALLQDGSAPDLLTVDTRFVRVALGNKTPEGRVTIVADTTDIAVVSTMGAARDGRGPRGLDCDLLGRWAANWCFVPADAGYFEWCFRHRVIYRAGEGEKPAPTEAERARVSEILSAYRHHAAAHLATGQSGIT